MDDDVDGVDEEENPTLNGRRTPHESTKMEMRLMGFRLEKMKLNNGDSVFEIGMDSANEDGLWKDLLNEEFGDGFSKKWR